MYLYFCNNCKRAFISDTKISYKNIRNNCLCRSCFKDLAKNSKSYKQLVKIIERKVGD